MAKEKEMKAEAPAPKAEVKAEASKPEMSSAEKRAMAGEGGFKNSVAPAPVAVHASIAEHAEARKAKKG